MIEFAWFYMLKAAIITMMLFFIIKPFYKEFKEKGEVTPKGKKVSISLAILLAVLVVFNPIKIDNSTSADMMRQSYDKTTEQNIEEIIKHDVTQYSPNNNEDAIKRILED